MLEVSLRDSLFTHARSACNGDLGISPSRILFDRSLDHENDITFFTDNNLDDVRNSSARIKIAWLLESPDLHSNIYDKIRDPNYYKLFNYILTHKKELLCLDDRFIFSPFGGCWIRPEEQNIYTKNKLVSIIASNKNDLIGHQLRHMVIKQYHDQFDAILGRGYQEIDSKLEGLANFRYSVVIENCQEDYWFTEKLIDCLVTGTIPIYWGCPDISKFFDTNGIITFSKISDLHAIFSSISPEDYESRQQAIHNNFQRAKSYTITEDYIFDHIIKKISLEN